MAVASPETLDPKSDKPDSSSENPNPNPAPAPAPAPAPSQPENPHPNPNPNPNPNLVTPPPPSFVPSFRPLGVPPMPQYSTIPNPNPNFNQNPSPSIQPPGVSAPVTYMIPGVAPGTGSVTISAPPMRYQPPNTPPMAYGQVLNGYMAVPPPGIPRFSGPYPTMFRPGFPPRPLPPMGAIPQIPRPPFPGVRGFPPVVTPVARPVVPSVAATEKPQTTVYVGKIASTVDNDFLLSLLRLCGPVKSWKRAQDPTDGSPKSFGFCEFEAAEGILRALRLLTKLNIDGQELVLNINQATREYLERYVEKKIEREKHKETENQALEKESEGAPGVDKQEPPKPAIDETTKDRDDSGDKENQENQKFGIVTDEDREADKDASEKITSMIEERLRTKPLPSPRPVQTPVDASAKSNSEVPSKSRDGDSDVDIMRSDKNDDETTSETKPATEHDKPETSSPDRGRRHDRSSRERGRERDLKREKERELERYERERERERVRREKERDMKIREAERLYNNRLKEWEAREREKEHQRLKEKEREKDRQRERRREISNDEDGSDDDEEDTRKRRRRSSTLEERRRKRQREKEDDLANRLKEEEEIAEAKKRALEEQKRIEETKSLPNQVTEENETDEMQVDGIDAKAAPVVQQTCEGVSAGGNDTGDSNSRNSIDGELTVGSVLSDTKQNNDAPAKKLGFGLVGSGKKTTVPSVFHEDDDENVEDKKMRPLVPIDYSTEELQAVQSSVSSVPPNLVAAAEFAKRISSVNRKEEKPEMERDRNGRPNDRVSRRERERNDDENTHYRNENKEKRDMSYERERGREEKPKPENKKLLDAKQLIDMIPKTKEELFAYEINWAIYDKHDLHEKMRPWISKKITEFLGEEEETLVDYIVSSTKDHVRASKMLDLLQSILDDEAEMFVLKMWRMLIFEIKRVEAGLSVKQKA